MCSSIIVYLNCTFLDQNFELEIKMIWNWLFSLFTNESLVSLSFEMLKELHSDYKDNEFVIDDNSDILSCGHCSNVNIVNHNVKSNLHDISPRKFCNFSSVNSAKLNQHHNEQSNRHSLSEINLLKNCRNQEFICKLEKSNKVKNLPDLIPEQERRQIALKSIGTKLRHISESFERNYKK